MGVIECRRRAGLAQQPLTGDRIIGALPAPMTLIATSRSRRVSRAL
jgi:hypothetical protein